MRQKRSGGNKNEDEQGWKKKGCIALHVAELFVPIDKHFSFACWLYLHWNKRGGKGSTGNLCIMFINVQLLFDEVKVVLERQPTSPQAKVHIQLQSCLGMISVCAE